MNRKVPLAITSAFVLPLIFAMMVFSSSSVSVSASTSTSKSVTNTLRTKQVADISEQSQKVMDWVNLPRTIIYHEKGKDVVIDKKAEVHRIVQLINKRLNGAKIMTAEVWPDFDVAPVLSGMDSLEFDYSYLQTSSFEYDGAHSSPIQIPGDKVSETMMLTKIQYNKLIFPLANKAVPSDISSDGNFSCSIFSYGDTSTKMNVNGRDAAAVFKISPIGTPNELIEYLKEVE